MDRIEDLKVIVACNRKRPPLDGEGKVIYDKKIAYCHKGFLRVPCA